MSQTKAQKAAAKAAKAVAAAYKSSLRGGDYSNSPIVKAATAQMAADLNAQALEALGGVVMPTRKRPKLTAAEKAARKRVLASYGRSNPARAARLGGGKKRTKKKTTQRRAQSAARTAVRSAARTASRPAKKRSTVKTVTAASVLKGASSKALQRWVCEGARRSGCGAGGTRVVTASGSFKRIRPLRQMMG